MPTKANLYSNCSPIIYDSCQHVEIYPSRPWPGSVALFCWKIDNCLDFDSNLPTLPIIRFLYVNQQKDSIRQTHAITSVLLYLSHEWHKRLNDTDIWRVFMVQKVSKYVVSMRSGLFLYMVPFIVILLYASSLLLFCRHLSM